MTQILFYPNFSRKPLIFLMNNIMTCKKCLITNDVPGVWFNADGVCNFCIKNEEYNKYTEDDLEKILTKVRKQKGRYQVLVGISGGFDSSLLLDYCINVWKLRVLAVHFDNNFNTPEADHNIRQMIKCTGVDAIVYHVNHKEYKKACHAFLMLGLRDADILNDMVMAEKIRQTSLTYNIKYRFNGHSYRTESSCPREWTYMDARYINSVFKTVYGRDIQLDLPTLWKQIYSAFRGEKHIDPFDYITVDYAAERERLIKTYDWQPYGEKHQENKYTDFVGYYYLPKFFGIDKRILYLSAMVRNGLCTKEEALGKLLENPIRPDSLEMIKNEFGFELPQHAGLTYRNFDNYLSLFRKFRWLLWIFYKLKLIRRGFYEKYTVA